MAKEKAAPFVPDAHHQAILDRAKAARDRAAEASKERDAENRKAAKAKS